MIHSVFHSSSLDEALSIHSYMHMVKVNQMILSTFPLSLQYLFSSVTESPPSNTILSVAEGLAITVAPWLLPLCEKASWRESNPGLLHGISSLENCTSAYSLTIHTHSHGVDVVVDYTRTRCHRSRRLCEMNNFAKLFINCLNSMF